MRKVQLGGGGGDLLNGVPPNRRGLDSCVELNVKAGIFFQFHKIKHLADVLIFTQDMIC